MTGTLIAYELLTRPDPPKSVVILEARELSSGATGRNAGHCKPDQVYLRRIYFPRQNSYDVLQYRGFAKYSKLVGAEQAKKARTICP